MVEWKKLELCLDYEQPTPYLVQSTEYDDSYDSAYCRCGNRIQNSRHSHQSMAQGFRVRSLRPDSSDSVWSNVAVKKL